MTIFGGLGGPQVYSSANGGKVYAFNSLSILVTVAPANPSRQKIRFHNPGANDMLIAPVLAYATVTANAPTTLTPTTTNKGGCFLVFANGGTLDINGECQGAWQALSADGVAGKLTIMDSNIGG